MKYDPPEIPDDLLAEMRLLSRGDAAVRILAEPSPVLHDAPPYPRPVAILAYLIWVCYGLANRDGGMLTKCKFPSEKWGLVNSRVRGAWRHAAGRDGADLLGLLTDRRQLRIPAHDFPTADGLWWRRAATEIDTSAITDLVLQDALLAAKALHECGWLWQTHGSRDRGTANAGPGALAEGFASMLPDEAREIVSADDLLLDDEGGAHPDDPIPAAAPAEPEPTPAPRKPRRKTDDAPASPPAPSLFGG